MQRLSFTLGTLLLCIVPSTVWADETSPTCQQHLQQLTDQVINIGDELKKHTPDQPPSDANCALILADFAKIREAPIWVPECFSGDEKVEILQTIGQIISEIEEGLKLIGCAYIKQQISGDERFGQESENKIDLGCP